MAKHMVIPQDGVFTHTEVGRHIRLWSRALGKPSSNACVISAHGVEAKINSSYPVANLPARTTVYFYGPHGYNLINPGLYDVVSRQVLPLESISANRLRQDYSLSKSQGKHENRSATQDGTGETYRWIAKDMHPGSQPGWWTAAHQRAGISSKITREVQMDVATIRARTVFSYVTLTQVIGELQKAGFIYEEIHCSFCRGFSGKPSDSWNPTLKNPQESGLFTQEWGNLD